MVNEFSPRPFQPLFLNLFRSGIYLLLQYKNSIYRKLSYTSLYVPFIVKTTTTRIK